MNTILSWCAFCFKIFVLGWILSKNANWTFDSSGQLWMEFLLTRSRCRPKTAWQMATGINVMLAAFAMLQSTTISKVLPYSPWKIFIKYFCKLISNWKGPIYWQGKRDSASLYSTPKSEMAELDGKCLLSSWKCRTDAGINNRTLPTCTSCPEWSRMPQVIHFRLFRNKSLWKCNTEREMKWNTPKQDFSKFRRWV